MNEMGGGPRADPGDNDQVNRLVPTRLASLLSVPTLALALACLAALPACEEDITPPPPARPSPPDAAQGGDPAPLEVLTDVTFADLYQIFMRRNLSIQEKSMLWATRYNDRWVRWTGKLIAFSPTGVKMRHLETTVTFDVSIIINQPQRRELRKILRVGQFYTYVARLTSYDDLFRTLYLDQGAIINPTPEGDKGKLVPIPPPLRVLPVDKPHLPGAPPAPDAGAPPAR